MMIGAHLDNLDEPSEASYRRLAAMRAEVVGTLWTEGTRHRRPIYDRLEELLARPTYCVRVGPSRYASAAAWAREARLALAELPLAALREGRVRLRALNEVNLPVEGGWCPEAYAAFLGAVRRALPLPPEVALVASPVSLGLPDWREWYARFLTACGDEPPFDRVAVNCYAHLVKQAGWFVGRGRPVDVTEIGTLAVAPGPERGRWLLDRCRDLAALGVESAQAFIVGGRSNGAWDERYVLSDEEATLIGTRDGSGRSPAGAGQSPLGAWGETPETTTPSPAGAGEGAGGEGSSQKMRGRGMFIWYLSGAAGGDPAAIGARAREAGLSYVLIKCGDDSAVWSQFTPRMVAALRAEGLGVFGWAYCYGASVEGELAVARTCLDVGADGYVADIEAEYEGRWREAERFADGLAALRDEHPGTLIGYSPLPVIDYHESLPYAQLNRVADVVLPQLYSRALGGGWDPDRLWEQWRRWAGLWREWGIPVPRIVPVGEAFGEATGDDLRWLAAVSAANGAPDLAAWEWSQARPEHWAALAELQRGVTAP